MNQVPIKCVAVMGATATGKSDLGVRLSRRFHGEVVSMDSRQVYRGMDIGTGKVTPTERGGIVHHLLDILDPREAGSAGRHAELARAAIDDIAARKHVPFLVGGTGLYFDAVIKPLIDVDISQEQQNAIRAALESRNTLDLYAELRRVDPGRAKELSPTDRTRITRALEIFEATGVPMSEHISEQKLRHDQNGAHRFLKIVLTMPRDRLRSRIAERTRAMYDAGWVQEVGRLLGEGYGAEVPGMRSLGYEEIARALSSGTDAGDTLEAVVTRTQQYAKRQETFFRKDKEAVWLDVTDDDHEARAEALVAAFIEASPQ